MSWRSIICVSNSVCVLAMTMRPSVTWHPRARTLHPLSNAGTCYMCVLTTLQLLQPFNGLFSRTTWVSRYQKGKTNLDFTGARDSEWQWHQLDHMHVCNSLQTDNHASTPPLCFLQAGCPSCRPTNSVKTLKANLCALCANDFVNVNTLLQVLLKSHQILSDIRMYCACS